MLLARLSVGPLEVSDELTPSYNIAPLLISDSSHSIVIISYRSGRWTQHQFHHSNTVSQSSAWLQAVQPGDISVTSISAVISCRAACCHLSFCITFFWFLYHRIWVLSWQILPRIKTTVWWIWSILQYAHIEVEDKSINQNWALLKNECTLTIWNSTATSTTENLTIENNDDWLVWWKLWQHLLKFRRLYQ
jgi:hypothetical protein